MYPARFFVCQGNLCNIKLVECRLLWYVPEGVNISWTPVTSTLALSFWVVCRCLSTDCHSAKNLSSFFECRFGPVVGMMKSLYLVVIEVITGTDLCHMILRFCLWLRCAIHGNWWSSVLGNVHTPFTSVSSFGATSDSRDIVVYTTHDLSEHPCMLYTELCVSLATFVLHMTWLM